MRDISHKRCSIHPDREAVALCRNCDRFFCRECITEFEGRALCSQCLEIISKRDRVGKRRGVHPGRAAMFLIGLFVLWLIFFYLGKVLILIPSSFHEGTIWKTDWRSTLDE